MFMVRLFLMLFPGMLLLGWALWKENLSCLILLVLMLPVLGLITLNMLEVALMRRRALVGMYLHADSWLSRLLCRRMFLLFRQVLKGVFFTFILFVEVLDWPAWFWWLTLADVLLVYMADAWLRNLLVKQVKPGQGGVIARRMLVTVNTLVLALLLATGQLFEKQVDYTGMSWQETAVHGAQQERVQCELIAPLVRLQTMQHALAGRFVHQGLEAVSSIWSRMAGWLLFFFWSGLSLWAWSRMLLGTLIRKPDVDQMVRSGCGQ
ncbi:MAG TPA: hypothetical protein EYP34_13895 [Chromatiaceae bacterium]|nr:hypothetical protein [Chromatiaceae bacterium]